MSWSITWETIDAFTAGAVGPPGERVFYLQFRAQGSVVALKCEKEQVTGLADFLEELLGDALALDEPSPSDMALVEPVLAEWIVGTIGVGHDEASGTVAVVIEELPVEEVAGQPVDPDAPVGSLQAQMTVGQARAFIEAARKAVTGGRES